MAVERVSMTLGEQKFVMLNILKEFVAFCDRHELMYYLDAGTLIGAVRHKGFIPWDDDIDINMPQVDYDRFVELAKQSEGYISEHLRVEFPEETIYPFLKISDDRTILVEFPDKNPMEVGVYMDVFPKYGIKDKSWRSKWLCNTTNVLGLIHWFNKYSIYAWTRPEHNVLKRLIAFVGQHTVKDSIWAVKVQSWIMHRYAKRNPLSVCQFVTTLTNGEYHKLAPKECFDGFLWLEFEGCLFKGPKDFDTYLRCLYKGDYMQLPPAEKRYHHATEVYWKSDDIKCAYFKKYKK